jgi:dihydrofolate synthase/folylpolyglutamate synthase
MRMLAPNESKALPRPLILLVGCSVDKDLAGIAAPLAPLADGVVLTQAHHYRAAAPEEMARHWQHHDVPVKVVPAVPRALHRARSWAGPAGMVCACGSFFIVAEVREALGLAVREPWPEPVSNKATRQ